MATYAVPTAKSYQTAFLALAARMTATRRKLLHAHYHSPHHQATATQIAAAMGWTNYVSANAHYGKLAQSVADQLGFHPAGCHLNALTTFVAPTEPGDQFLIIMRPQVANALEQLGWV
jgi:dihydroxyacid dehydratase/phosphogluconate dehydratase